MKKPREAFGFSVVCLFVVLAAAPVSGEKAPGRAVVFTKHVAPILHKSCVGCHRPGEIAPMPLLSYADARPWAKAIREAVATRTMPPWYASPKSRACENDPRLQQREIDTITAWVDGGAKQGDPKDMPAAPALVGGWNIGKPDMVFAMQEEFAVPPEGVVPYKYFTIPTNLEKDTWIQAAEIRPGNRAVVHHVIAFIREPGARRMRGLTGTAPGMPPLQLRPGEGLQIKAGSTLVLQMHYTPNGFAEKDRTSIGLVVARTPIERPISGAAIMNEKFRIPAGDPNYEVRASFTLPNDARLISVMPHMHVRGKDFKYTVVFPDGREELILEVPRWDFNWQQTYRFREPLLLPKGSRIDCVAHFDNSPGNKFNPNPKVEVSWGDQTWEEMMIGFADLYYEKTAAPTGSGGAEQK